jgi:hypothetical protein
LAVRRRGDHVVCTPLEGDDESGPVVTHLPVCNVCIDDMYRNLSSRAERVGKVTRHYTEMVLKALNESEAVVRSIPGIWGCQCNSLTSF